MVRVLRLVLQVGEVLDSEGGAEVDERLQKEEDEVHPIEDAEFDRSLYLPINLIVGKIHDPPHFGEHGPVRL